MDGLNISSENQYSGALEAGFAFGLPNCNKRPLRKIHQSTAIICRATTQKGRKARPASQAIADMPPDAEKALDWHAAAKLALAEPTSDIPIQFSYGNDADLPLAKGDGRRPTDADYDNSDAEMPLDAKSAGWGERATFPVSHSLQATEMAARRREIDASIASTASVKPNASIGTDWTALSVTSAAYPAGPYEKQLMPHAGRQIDPWQVEEAFLSRVFSRDLAQRVVAATEAALDGAPSWLGEELFNEITCDGLKCEAAARRIGRSGATVRAAIKAAGKRLAAHNRATRKILPLGTHYASDPSLLPAFQ